jgi:hypothetical protein
MKMNMSVCSSPWCRPSLQQYGGQAGAPCRGYHSPAAQQQPKQSSVITTGIEKSTIYSSKKHPRLMG